MSRNLLEKAVSGKQQVRVFEFLAMLYLLMVDLVNSWGLEVSKKCNVFLSRYEYTHIYTHV